MITNFLKAHKCPRANATNMYRGCLVLALEVLQRKCKRKLSRAVTTSCVEAAYVQKWIFSQKSYITFRATERTTDKFGTISMNFVYVLRSSG